MNIREYLEIHYLTIPAFAELVGVSPYAVKTWIWGTRFPTIENAYKVEKATKGKITFEELRSGKYRSISASTAKKL